MRFRAVCGKAGISAHKQEGDEATPAARLALLNVLYRADRVETPRCGVPVAPISPGDGWCDDVGDAAYNRMVRLPYAGRHEKLWRVDGIYDVIGVLDWNVARAFPGQGSGIFLHAARADFAPTEGCVALALQDLLVCLGSGLSAILVLS